ncbi:MAG: hypothetical protein PHF86_13745 [Candidatus Nanoarchaeia archaeon]|nr:hypothetical protein [Candidatus Nanoarchaeia archaeon]
MKELHIIVHEEAVEAYADLGLSTAKEVLKKLQEIKSSQNYLEISEFKNPNKLHSDMPNPSEDLEIIVSGGYTKTCCTMQLFALKKAGYNARFHPTACCPGQGSLGSIMMKEILEEYPNFFEGLLSLR